MLDAVERALLDALPPAIARRFTPPVIEHHDSDCVVDGRPHQVFLRVQLEPAEGQLLVFDIAVLARPA